MTVEEPSTSPGERRLVMLRHAKAEPSGDRSDTLRALAVAGRYQCSDVGARLVAAGLVPELVLVSSAVRARQTWELVLAGFGDVPQPEVRVSDDLYGAGPRDVLALLQGIDEGVSSVLVVGHEPTMSVTASMLADPASPAGDLSALRSGLPVAGFAVLGVGRWADVDRSALRLLEVVRPQR
jgi:phosphohistidine phosphatase